MRVIRASEISAYVYCRRAWWYARQGQTPANRAALAGGVRIHEQHGRQVFSAGCLRVLAYGFLLLALALFTVYLTQLFF